jgi:trigger factor
VKVTKEISRLENSAVKLTATISKEDVASGYSKSVAKYAKNVQIPGFRKGHVPAKVIEQKFGDVLKQDSIADLIDESLNQIFAEEESRDIRPLPYAQPRLEDDKIPEFSLDKDLTFSVVYDVFPSVEVKDFSGIEVKEFQVEIGEKEISEELKAIQERNATILDKKDDDAAEKGDVISISYKELDDAGNVIDGSVRDDFVFTLGSGENIYKIDDEITGMKKGESKEISKTYAADDADKNLAGRTKKISIKVNSLKIRNLPQLDDDLAQDVSEKYKTLDDLKKDIVKNLELARDRKVKELKSSGLLEQLIEKNPIVLPRSMVEAERDSRLRMIAQQYNMNVEQLNKVFAGQKSLMDSIVGDSEKMLKGRLIVETLLQEKNISATPEEVEAEYKKIAEESGSTLDEVKERYKDPRAAEYVLDEIKENKLYEELYKQVKVSSEKKDFASLFSEK